MFKVLCNEVAKPESQHAQSAILKAAQEDQRELRRIENFFFMPSKTAGRNSCGLK